MSTKYFDLTFCYFIEYPIAMFHPVVPLPGVDGGGLGAEPALLQLTVAMGLTLTQVAYVHIFIGVSEGKER